MAMRFSLLEFERLVREFVIVSRDMSVRIPIAILIFIFADSVGAGAQKQTGAESFSGAQEFPVVFQSRVTSGKTSSGTKIQAKLSMATLLNGIVVPRNATFSGQVVISDAGGKNKPSRLSVRMDLVSWKDRSMSVKIFLTEKFYAIPVGNLVQSSQSGPVLWNDSISSPPPAPKAATSPQLERMRDVQIERGNDGTITLFSERHPIKIDRSTTYVLTTDGRASTVQ
jgi:hypothetical protein